MKKHDKAETKTAEATVAETVTEPIEIPAHTEPISLEERISQLEGLLAAKEAESKENWDRFLRERADMENLRKRTNREKEELLNYGTKSLLEEILPVVDNLERALEHANEESLSALVEGVRMTHSILISALKKFGATPIESTGAVFDPAFHQAMSQTPTDEFPPNTIVTEFQKGYMIKDRLLRPAMVSVSVAPK
jgi:molecular chaperone GrpE